MVSVKQLRATSPAQTLVEFALVVPLFFFLLFGVIEGGRLVYSYNAINHAAQEAVRYGVVADAASASAVRDRAIEAADPLTINAGNVQVEVNGGARPFGDREIGDRLSVAVEYDFTPIILMVFGSSAPIHLTADSELMVE